MWWPLPEDLSRIARERVPGLDAARARVQDLLDRQMAAHPGRAVILGGFSQGAITTLELALHDGRPLAGIALLSGTPSDEAGMAAHLDRRRGLRVYVSHGRFDAVLRYEDDARLVETLRAHGLDVWFTSFDGGHVVTDEVSTELAAFITRCAASP
jgi:phospholipase/carboxylesterase